VGGKKEDIGVAVGRNC